MKTILIADAGGTSTDWALIRPDGETLRFKTGAFNAVHTPVSELRKMIASIGLPTLCASDPTVRFYGAGCRGEASERVREELARALGPLSDVEVSSDLLGTARALCGHSEGIACILGTGSNSCLYDGKEIVANTPSLGYILGDEGSGAVIGRRFLGLLFKGHFPEPIAEDFRSEYPDIADVNSIITEVYKGETPSRFLASFMPFIGAHAEDPQVHSLLREEFDRFFRLNILPYRPSEGTQVHFTGSVALHFTPLLRESAEAFGLLVGRIVASPMDGLIDYHSAPNV